MINRSGVLVKYVSEFSTTSNDSWVSEVFDYYNALASFALKLADCVCV